MEMSPEYKAVRDKINATLKESGLSEMQKYALLAGCLAEVAHAYNGSQFPIIKGKLALVAKTMLDGVEKAEYLYTNLKNLQSK